MIGKRKVIATRLVISTSGVLSGFNIKLNDTMLYYLNIDSSVTDISDSTMITYKQRYKHIIYRKIIFIEERNIKRKSKKYYK